MKRLLINAVLLIFFIGRVAAVGDTLFVSPQGAADNPGTFAEPLADIETAVNLIAPGGTVFLRGGTYYPTGPINIRNDGISSTNRSKLFGYSGETAIIDGSQSSPIIYQKASNWHLKSFSIMHGPSYGYVNWGDQNNNVLENIVAGKNGNTGINISGSADSTLILNCDSYENYDALKHGEDADGFGIKGLQIGKGNVIRGCRAWGNSDDGYDLFWTGNQVLIENCRAWGNGVNIWGDTAFSGNGHGFKLGKDDSASSHHICQYNVSWNNVKSGFNDNGNLSGITLRNNTSYNNGVRNYWCFTPVAHVLQNNISFSGSISLVSDVVDTYNTWNLSMEVTADDFLSVDDTVERGPRQHDGSLPRSDFLRLAPGSALIDAGVAWEGCAFSGNAPDLGAFEYTDQATALRPGTRNGAAPRIRRDGAFLLVNIHSVPGATVSLYTLRGRLIFRAKTGLSESKISLAGLAGGLYEVVIRCPRLPVKRARIIVT